MYIRVLHECMQQDEYINHCKNECNFLCTLLYECIHARLNYIYIYMTYIPMHAYAYACKCVCYVCRVYVFVIFSFVLDFSVLSSCLQLSPMSVIITVINVST